MSVTRYCQAGHKFIIDGTMAEGETITVTVEPADGYSFVSWDDGNSDNPRQIYIDSCGEVFTARFTSSGPTPPSPTLYHISVTACPSSAGSVYGSGDYPPGTEVQIGVTPHEGWEQRFIGWNQGTDRTSLVQTITVTQPLLYQAEFEGCLDYTWSGTPFPSLCVGVVTPATQTVHHGGTATISFTPSEHYIFEKWAFNGGTQTLTDNPYTMNPVIGGMNFQAYAKAVIEVESGTGGTAKVGKIENGVVQTEVVDGTVNLSYQNSARITATPNSGYTFSHWTFNGTQMSFPAQHTITFTACQGGVYKAHFTQSTTTFYWKSAATLNELRVPLSQYEEESYTSLPYILDLGTYATNGNFKRYTAFVVPNGRSVSCLWLDALGGDESFNLTSSHGCYVTGGAPSGYTCLSGHTSTDDTVGYSSAKFTIS